MQYEVSQSTIVQTEKCVNKIACLSGDTSSLCDVESISSDKCVFIKPKKGSICAYLVRFGLYHHICACPVRRELHQKARCSS